MSNYVSNENATALMSAIGKKKLTVTDVMPLAASAANEGIPYLYLGVTTQDFSNGSIYECQEVTPATDPKTYEWVEKYQSSVDLTYYKRIWGGTEDGWNQLTDEQKANYEYTFFSGDSDYTLDVVDAVTDGDMRPVTSNAVYDALSSQKNPTNLMTWQPSTTSRSVRDLGDSINNYTFILIEVEASGQRVTALVPVSVFKTMSQSEPMRINTYDTTHYVVVDYTSDTTIGVSAPGGGIAKITVYGC